MIKKDTVFLRGASADVRFDFKHIVLLDTGCWKWIAGLFDSGYGQFNVEGKNWRAHVWSWTRENGLVPEGLQLDHYRYPGMCVGPACVNPSHLRPTTPRENTLRGDTITSENAAKSHCKNGHEFTFENTYIRPDGGRTCRTCQNETCKRYRASKSLN